MNKESYPREVWYFSYAFPKFNVCTVDVCEWNSDFILHVKTDLIICPGYGENVTILMKGLRLELKIIC